MRVLESKLGPCLWGCTCVTAGETREATGSPEAGVKGGSEMPMQTQGLVELRFFARAAYALNY